MSDPATTAPGQLDITRESPLSPLTPRLREIVELMMDGITTDREIAHHLGVAPKTAANHVQRLLDLTGAHSRQEAFIRVLQKRWMTLEVI